MASPMAFVSLSAQGRAASLAPEMGSVKGWRDRPLPVHLPRWGGRTRLQTGPRDPSSGIRGHGRSEKPRPQTPHSSQAPKAGHPRDPDEVMAGTGYLSGANKHPVTRQPVWEPEEGRYGSVGGESGHNLVGLRMRLGTFRCTLLAGVCPVLWLRLRGL